MTERKLNERQEKFCEAVASGILPKTASRLAGYKKDGMEDILLDDPLIVAEIEQKRALTKDALIAGKTEILGLLTSVMRGDVCDPVVVMEQRTGKEGKIEKRARVINKTASVKERMSAAELLGRRYGLLSSEDDGDGIIIYGEENLISDGEYGEED